jgi:uncharacterized protein (TIGR03083 family)
MDWIPLLDDATTRFADAAASGDLDAPVPTCPEWTLADLVRHLGWVHRWAAHAVTDGTPDGNEPYAGDPAGLVDWYRGAARHLVDVLAERDAEAPAWTFGPDKVAGFWRRRQVHETLVHEYDALAAVGREADWSTDPALAWDGVDEVATFFYPRQVRLERIRPLAGTLRLVPTDVDAAALEIGASEPVAELTRPSSYLLLALWKRVPVEDPVAAELLRTAITP